MSRCCWPDAAGWLWRACSRAVGGLPCLPAARLAASVSFPWLGGPAPPVVYQTTGAVERSARDRPEENIGAHKRGCKTLRICQQFPWGAAPCCESAAPVTQQRLTEPQNTAVLEGLYISEGSKWYSIGTTDTLHSSETEAAPETHSAGLRQKFRNKATELEKPGHEEV